MSTSTFRRTRRAALGALLCASLLPGLALAQAYPAKPVRIVVPYAAGGAVDTLARIIGAQLAKQMGQPVIVENKPGASANLGAEYVAHADPDGYTLLLGANGLTTNMTLYRHLRFNTLKDFAPVAKVGYAPLVLVVNPSLKTDTLKDLLALAKSQPGKLFYGSSGNGSSGHLAVESLKLATGIDVAHVPYKGGAPALQDLLGGRIAFVMTNPLEVVSYIRSGQLHALAVGASKRIDSLPGVPTFPEAGVPNYEASVWWGMVAPAKTPKDIVAKLSDEMLKALNDAQVRAKLEKMGAVIEPRNAQQFGAFLKEDVARWAKVIRTAGIHAD